MTDKKFKKFERETLVAVHKILEELKSSVSDFSYFDINPEKIEFYPESAAMCEMNSCGCYNTNWACAPAVRAEELFSRVKEYKCGALLELNYEPEDEFDWNAMEEAEDNFSKLCRTIKRKTDGCGLNAFILGAGACKICGTCAYPDNPCRRPEDLIYPIEAAGIDASSLLKALGESDGTAFSHKYLGLVLYNRR